MAETRSFHGYRFRLDTPEDLGRYASPPYDMIDEAMRDRLYETDPYNFVRIVQNRPEPDDGANIARHRRAAALLTRWLAEGKVVRDDAPGIYIYRQRFTVEKGGSPTEFVRTGVTVRVKLVDFEKGIVQPHEYTLSGPRTDRYELMQSVRFDTGQIFGIAGDEESLYRAIGHAAESSEPLGRFVDANQVQHELLRTTDRESCARIHAILADRTVLIADGHHRYETALKFARDTTGEGYVMMTIVSMADPGLVIRPFHRVVKKNATSERFRTVRDLEPWFSVADLGEAQPEAAHRFVGGEGKHDMLFLDGGDGHLYGLSLAAEGARRLKDEPDGKSELWNGLAVSMINRFCVRQAMGLEPDGHVLHEVMDYLNDMSQAYDRAVRGEVTGTFFIRPITIETIRQIVAQGERMPQKSTNFYPKLYSGLVLNKLGNG